MRTIETVVYTFDELSDDAKQKALDNNREINVDYSEWYDYVYDNFVENTTYFKVDRIYFSGFWSQGDGAMFEYSDITNELFHKAIDSLKISNWKKQFLKNNCTIYGKGRHRGHYYHEKCCEHIIEVENQYRSEYPNIENFIDECEIEIIDFIIQEYESLARTLYKDLMAAYEDLTSDECVADTLIANEYEFLENGKRV